VFIFRVKQSKKSGVLNPEHEGTMILTKITPKRKRDLSGEKDTFYFIVNPLKMKCVCFI
jgi:hypothetical protein